jgi:dihydrofolate reductase
MALVTAHISVSLDGFFSGPEHLDAGFHRVTRWAVDTMAWRERQGLRGGERNVNSGVLEEMVGAPGAHVMGRKMFDLGEIPWGDNPPFGAPVFVVTHRPRETVQKEGGTSFTFVTDGIARAIEQAREAAGGGDVTVAGGGALVRQALREGLVDQLELNVTPVLLGDGMRVFEAGEGEAIELTPTRVVDTPEVTHLRYRVDGPRPLTKDSRGREEGAEA